MIFLDLDNFRQSLILRDRDRKFDFGKFQYFLIRFLNNKIKFSKCNEESLIRTYAYTGEYTSKIIEKAESPELIEMLKRRMKAQQTFFDIVKKFNFFELKTLPLKYEDGKIFQKGIDVKIAIDLLYHAFQDNFDIAVICSGDIDLMEAVRLSKKLGKRIIIVSHPNLISKELRKEADYFINIQKLTDEELNEFSRTKNANMD